MLCRRGVRRIAGPHGVANPRVRIVAESFPVLVAQGAEIAESPERGRTHAAVWVFGELAQAIDALELEQGAHHQCADR
ncbi:MAG: hypothetical protein HOO96_29825 [Polyangiaceae bacterium]|nr:hypothetical protein [Polyangiaceae bacterium]